MQRSTRYKVRYRGRRDVDGDDDRSGWYVVDTEMEIRVCEPMRPRKKARILAGTLNRPTRTSA